MAQPVRITLKTALLSASLPALLTISWWLSQSHRLPTPDEPCDLQNWGCSTGTSLIGALLLIVIPAVFPLFAAYAQRRLIWRNRTVFTVPQMVVSLLPAPLILSLVAVVLGVQGNDELAVAAFLACVPTTVVTTLQQALIRRKLLRQGMPRSRSHPAATPSVYLFFSFYALLLLTGSILTWGPMGKSWQQLIPGLTLFLLFLAFCTGICAAGALYFVARSLATPTPLGRLVRVSSVLAGIVGVVVISAWGLLTALVQDEVVEEVTIDGSTYLATKVDYPPICYHAYDGGTLMERDCVLAEQLGLSAPDAQLPSDLAGTPSPGSQSSQSAPQASEIPPSSEDYPPVVVVASRGDFGIIQTDASLGQKGTYASARYTGGSWTPGTTIIEDATFTDFVRVHGLLLAAFAPNPDFALMVSSDDGRTWRRADLYSAAIPEDMRYFHDLSYDGGVFTLTTGHPDWVDSDQTNQWTSNDGLAWQPLGP